ncbi:hypothetical protein HK405_004564, partial [Cladochytrium tenue]
MTRPLVSLTHVAVAATFLVAPAVAAATAASSAPSAAALRVLDAFLDPAAPPIPDALVAPASFDRLLDDVSGPLAELVRLQPFRYYWSSIPESLRAEALSGLSSSLGVTAYMAADPPDALCPPDHLAHSASTAAALLTGPEPVPVDLVRNPERFTGYAGPSAARVWRAVYEENCFGGAGASQLAPAAACVEERVFYRLASGMHASINTHVCNEILDLATGTWHSDASCFAARIGAFPDRLENLHFSLALHVRATARIAPLLRKNTPRWIADAPDGLEAKQLLSQILSAIENSPPSFDEGVLLSSPLSLKEELSLRVRNLSRIMDCVACEKCRLWGKLQVA